MVTSTWICPACGTNDLYKDDPDGEWMECECEICGCKFTVNLPSTEMAD